jgi:hypothetical protein
VDADLSIPALQRAHRASPGWAGVHGSKAQAANLTGQVLRRFPGGEIYHDFRYQVICLWELPAQMFLQGGLGTLPLALLTDDAEPQLLSLVSQIGERLRAESVPHETANTLWTASYLLLGLRYDKQTVARVLRGVQGMEESVTYKEILTKGLLQARKEDVLSLLVERFALVPESIEQQIRSATDPDRLKAALRQIVRIQTIDEFRL